MKPPTQQGLEEVQRAALTVLKQHYNRQICGGYVRCSLHKNYKVAPLDIFEALDWVAVVMSDGSLPTTLGCVAVG